MIELKEIPTNTTKAKIRKMYSGINEKYVIKVYQAAVKKVNETTTNKVGFRDHTLNYHHVRYIVNELGPAPGYRDFNEKLKDN
jgi:hypothetical protein